MLEKDFQITERTLIVLDLFKLTAVGTKLLIFNSIYGPLSQNKSPGAYMQ